MDVSEQLKLFMCSKNGKHIKNKMLCKKINYLA